MDITKIFNVLIKSVSTVCNKWDIFQSRYRPDHIPIQSKKLTPGDAKWQVRAGIS